MAKDVDEIIYTHVPNQHPDSIRFLHDCEKVLGRKITVLQSERFKDVDDVILKQRYINGPGGAPCTRYLKREVRRQWEREHPDHHIYVWGMDANEKRRAERLERSMSDYEHEFPLIEHGLTKEDAHGLAAKLGIRRPLMYDLGYHNNNCIGCVRGGKGYWNRVRRDFPEVFRRRAEEERIIGHSCINGVFLDELDPDAGRNEKEIMEDCSIICELAIKEMNG